jgi:hypothetical protein
MGDVPYSRLHIETPRTVKAIEVMRSIGIVAALHLSDLRVMVVTLWVKFNCHVIPLYVVESTT